MGGPGTGKTHLATAIGTQAIEQHIREKFVQRCTKWNFDEKQWICRSPSDLDVVAREMNVETRGRQWDDIQKDILDAARTRAFALDPDDQIEKVKALVLNLAQFKLANIKGHQVVDQMMAKAAAAKLHFTFELSDKLQDDPMVALSLLRRDFEDFRIANGTMSCPDASDGIALRRTSFE